MATQVTRTRAVRNHLKVRLRHPLRCLGRARNSRAPQEDPTIVAVAKAVAVHPVGLLPVVGDSPVARLVGVHSRDLPIIHRRTHPGRTIPSSKTSCKSVAKRATWMPCERMLMPLLAVWVWDHRILGTTRAMDHLPDTTDRPTTLTPTNRCISKRWTLIRTRNLRRRCMT